MIRDWYIERYPTDELGVGIDEETSFLDVVYTLSTGGDIYKTIGVSDSIVRERIFRELAERLGVSVEDIYELWLRD